MTTLLENPMPIVLFGIVVEAILGGFLVTTRRGVLLVPMAGVFLLVILGVVVERLVVTEKERAEQALYDAAAAIQSNDVKRVESFIAKTPGSDVLRRASHYMGLVEFEQVKISGLRVTLNRLTSPPSAEARFNGSARFQDRSGMIPYRYYRSDFKVDLVLEPDGWKVKDVQGDPQKPLAGGSR